MHCTAKAIVALASTDAADREVVMKINPNNFRRLVCSTLSGLLIFSAANSYADDTEVFFGGPAIGSGIRPNVLFILDNSGSMAWSTKDQYHPDEADEESRMQVLKDSFSTIINNAGAINAGIMVLNPRSTYNNTRMVYPVSYLDSPLPGTAQQVASTPQILVSGDDATQKGSATTAVINEPSLPMGKFQVLGGSTTNRTLTPGHAFLQKDDHSCLLDASLASSRPNGTACRNISQNQLGLDKNDAGTAMMFFSGLGIPANSTVTSATLTIYPQHTSSGGLDPRVSVELGKLAVPLNDNTSIVGRTFSAWRDLADTAWSNGTPVTLDITAEINGLRSLAHASSAVENLVLRLKGNHNNERTLCMRAGSGCVAGELPVLNITYTSPTPGTDSRNVGLRFQNVGIPQGATITSARISFVPAVDGDEDVTLHVKAENTGDAAVFSNTTNLSGRAKPPAVVTWDVPDWVAANPPVHVEGPDVQSLVQGVVNQGSWCGNNAMAFHLEYFSGNGARTAYGIDGAPGLQPTLTVTYTGGDGGCLNPIIEASVTKPKNDAYEENDGDMSLGDNTLPVDRSRFAARYENVPLINGATILDAQVILTPANTVNSPPPNVTTTVRFENAANSAPFTSADGNISGRTGTPGSSCLITRWVTGGPVICNAAQLKTGLQSIVNRSGWTSGNALTVMSEQSGDTSLDAQAYESNPAQSVKIRIKVASGGVGSNTAPTVRQHLKGLVQAMNAGDGTPLVPTYYEAAQYLRGDNSNYASPITSACQPTHVVLLTDGQAYGNTTASRTGITSWAGSCSSPLVTTGEDPGIADTASTDVDEQCGRKLAEWLAQEDQSTLTGDNIIKTHTIGFALGALGDNTAPQDFLNHIADNGGGEAYTAADAGQLSSAFSKIMQSVQSIDTTFVSPGAAVNQFNRQSNKNEVYFALFKPSKTNLWVGNLKRYAINSGAGPIILDADNTAAIDPTTGFFDKDARSFWSSSDDGNNTALGGVASQLPVAGSRKAFTYIGTSPNGAATNLNVSAHQLADGNAGLTSAMLGAANSAERTELINWVRGLNTDGSARKAIGDPLHSVPRLVTYACNTFTDNSLTACSSEDQSAFVGTNEGFVHAFDTNTGVEQLAFMPQELLDNIKDLKTNAESSPLAPRKYGMDNTVAMWVNDLNKNGVIYGGRDPDSTSTPPTQLSGRNSGEFVYAYPTMGRGGRSIYALDVTDRNNPKMLWFKDSTSAGFERLGQTWSTPVVTKINVNGTETQVLMFAGGYDPQQDTVKARTADTMGNAIYIVNAKTGALIWSASSASGHSLQLSKLLYSMPAALRVIDIDRDGLADQFFATDMGGQVWRFFINNGNAASSLVSPLDSGSSGVDDGIFASVIPADTVSPLETAAALESKLRRFYNEPSVALLTVAGSKTMVVSVGSGYRGHPLYKGTADRFYSFRTPIIAGNAAHSVLTESDLYDATDNLIQAGSTSEKAAAASAFTDTAGGWYIRLTNPGEKVLSDAITFSGHLFFNTYEPATTAASSCNPVQGVGRAYMVNVYDATPVAQNLDGNPGARFSSLKAGGIPPRPIVLFPDTGSSHAKDPVVCVGTECSEVEWPAAGATYWIDES
jgi:type IV pilus assembly protein PilY1